MGLRRLSVHFAAVVVQLATQTAARQPRQPHKQIHKQSLAFGIINDEDPSRPSTTLLINPLPSILPPE